MPPFKFGADSIESDEAGTTFQGVADDFAPRLRLLVPCSCLSHRSLRHGHALHWVCSMLLTAFASLLDDVHRLIAESDRDL
jgi:hypothetical protein